MTSIQPSSSPRWDLRNQGFVSPAQLQQWKQQQRASTLDLSSSSSAPQSPQNQSTLSSHSPQPLPSQQMNTQPGPPGAGAQSPPQNTPPSAPTHSRTTSSFSFFKLKQPQQDTQNLGSPPQSPPAYHHRQQDTVNDSPRHNLLRRSTDHAQPQDQPPTPGSSTLPQAQTPGAGPGPRPESSSLAPRPSTGPPQLHPEIRSIVNLTIAHGQKIYFSGPMVRKLERQADGQKPAKDDGWRDIWAQLGGTTLSVWDMKEIDEASKEGRQVPPSYINVTDAFIQVVGAINIPAMAGQPPQKYMNVFALNTAGMNMLLFSCPNMQALISWVAAIRLAAWEKSRLEEMYTAHLIRITLNDGRDAPSPLVQGKMEGWVRVRLAGQTDWKRLWMMITAAGVHHHDGASVSSTDIRSASPHAPRKKRISSLFSRERSPAHQGPSKPVLQLFASQKPKDKKKALLTFQNVIQAFAVYPERPELISRSTLMKLEGLFGDEEMAGSMKNKEGWLLIMPDFEGGAKASEMLKWLIGIHDVFELYGRPRLYSWDPRDLQSMMFAYPIGPHKELLFLDREFAETLDIRDDRTSSSRSALQRVLWDRMRGPTPDKAQPPIPRDEPPSLPPLPRVAESESDHGLGSSSSATGAPLQLPLLSFERDRDRENSAANGSVNKPEPPVPRALTPITERSGTLDASRSPSDEQYRTGGTGNNAPSLSLSTPHLHPPPAAESQESAGVSSVYTGMVTTSPTSIKSPSEMAFSGSHHSEEHPAAAARADSSIGHDRPPPTSSSPPPLSDMNNRPSISNDTDTKSTGASSRPLSPEAELQTFAANVRRGATSPQWERHSFTTVSNPPSMVSPQPTSSSSFSHLVPSPPLGSPGLSSQTSGRPTSPPTQPSSASTARHNAPVDQHGSASIRLVSARTDSTDSFPFPLPSPTKQAGQGQYSPQKQAPSIAQMQDSEEVDRNILGDAGAALSYMRRLEGNAGATPPRLRQVPPATGDDEDEESSESSSAYTPPPDTQRQSRSTGAVSPLRINKSASPSPPPKSPPSRHMPGPSSSSSNISSPAPTASANSGFKGKVSSPPPDRDLGHQAAVGVGTPNTRYGLVAKPSGARAAPGNKTTATATSSWTASSRRELPPSSQPLPTPPNEQQEREQEMATQTKRQSTEVGLDEAADALAVLDFLDREEEPSTSTPQNNNKTQSRSPQSPVSSPSPPPVPQVVEPPKDGSTDSHQYRSTFTPSKTAAERKAKLQAQQAAKQAAKHKPGGRVNGKARPRHTESGAWGESSDEEEEEEEEEEDDDEEVDSDEEPTPARGRQQPPQNAPPSNGPPSDSTGRPGYPPSARGISPGPSSASVAEQQTLYPQPRRPPRDLPQVPGDTSNEYLGPQPAQSRRFVSGQYSDSGRQSMYPDSTRRPSPHRPGSEFQQMAAARQSVWSQVLEPGRPAVPPDNHSRDKFVQIEPVEATMTKAFTPHGLLSAGLQDKFDRSAKRREELARETGASLIDVPNKPPPPQTGLLGAVSAIERERKRDGGIGATLTEREREKRVAEERQRKLDEYQRMQLEQMQQQQTGSMYGMPPMGFNPMMGNPMMNNPMMPMMTGGWGYPGMMNPQHMFAAQQAAQAYQQAMMAFSVAGSQAGGPGEGASPAPQLNPMMTGASMMDPRMSMMGMPMMSPAMGMNPGMMGMGGMGQGMQGMQGMNPMGMGMNPQMTGGGGGGAFDPRFSQAFGGGGLGTPNEVGGEGGPNNGGQRPFAGAALQNGSGGGGQGSPAGAFRSRELGGEPPRQSAANDNSAR